MKDPADKGVAQRLFIGFILIVAMVVVSWKILPAAGVYVPWYVPVLAFIVIIVSVLARRIDAPVDDDDDDDTGIAGRIDPDGLYEDPSDIR